MFARHCCQRENAAVAVQQAHSRQQREHDVGGAFAHIQRAAERGQV
jgi:hypothetical protein